MDEEVLTPIEVTAEIKQYQLVGDDIYVKRYDNDTIPDWYKQLIEDILASSNTINDMQDVINYLNSLPDGYNILISNLQNKDELIDTVLESLKTTNGEQSAVIASLDTTKVDAASAQAISRDTIASYFIDGSAGAWFNNEINTYANQISAAASSIGTLSVSLDNTVARIDTIDTLNIGFEEAITSIVNIDIPALQNQIDGAMTTWFQSVVPTLANYPASEWTTVELKNIHLGDIYYDKTTGYAYRFSYEDIPDDNPDMGIIYSWVRIIDSDITAALEAASTAQDTADGKSTVYYQTTAPTGLLVTDKGDVWVNSTTNAISTWTGTAWIASVAAANAATLAALATLQETDDGVVNSFYQTTAPVSGMSYGDWWIDTDAVPKLAYRYEDINGKNLLTMSWVNEPNDIIGKAFIAADTAQTTADGKIKVWYQTTAPTGLTASDIGDIWVDTDANNITYTWSGSAWVATSTSSAQTALTWSATSSKLITAPDGSITGWSMGDGTDIKSFFQIYATNFKISDGTTGFTPFSIAGSDITFNGKVAFTNITSVPVINKTWVQTTQPSTGMVTGDTWIDIDDSNKLYTYDGTSWLATQTGAITYLQTTEPISGMVAGDIWIDSDDNYKQYRYDGTFWIAMLFDAAAAVNANITTIDGGKITAGSITAGQIAANTITADKIFGVDIDGYTITGANIVGGSITGAVIKASWLDMSTVGYLTNWQLYTATTIPPAYIANFAHNNDGSLAIDSNGYVRLPRIAGTFGADIMAQVQTCRYTIYVPSTLLTLSGDGLCSYDSYAQPSTRRLANLNTMRNSSTLLTADFEGYVFTFYLLGVQVRIEHPTQYYSRDIMLKVYYNNVLMSETAASTASGGYGETSYTLTTTSAFIDIFCNVTEGRDEYNTYIYYYSSSVNLRSRLFNYSGSTQSNILSNMTLTTASMVGESATGATYSV